MPLDRVRLMGILNVTPDSFSDGGLWLEPPTAIEHGLAMVEEGADIVDVGGESTRPGADPVPVAEELRRVLPVVRALAGEGVTVSIDTRKAEVAAEAIEAGAAIVNDTLGEEEDPRLDGVAAVSGAAMVVMHSRGTPATMKSMTTYGDVVSDVRDWLAGRTERLLSAGFARDSIAIDPGIGFAKGAVQNLALLNHLDELVTLGYPVLVGTSRKSFIGAILDLPEGERVDATVATAVLSTVRGARLIRVHDVTAVLRAVRMTEAVLES